MILLLIYDDQVIVCEGLRAIWRTLASINVVGVAHDGHEALEKRAHTNPDVVLMDLKMRGMNGCEIM